MPDRKNPPLGGKPEFEVAWYTKEMGRPLQRQMLQQQLATLSDASRHSHGEDPVSEATQAPPSDDRAG